MYGGFYDPIGHRYYYDDAPWPSVTQILRLTGQIDSRWWTDGAAEHGRRVHRYCELIQRSPTSMTLPDDVAAEVDAYAALCRDRRVRITAIEQPAFNLMDRFGGRPDRHVIIGGFPGTLEIKTGAEARWHDLQTAGYQRLDPTGARWLVYLGRNGRYKLRRCTHAADHLEFLRALREVWASWQTLQHQIA